MRILKTMLITATVLLAQPAVSQDTDTKEVSVNQQFGQWVVACQVVTVSKNLCRLVQEQILRETDKLVARFIAQPAPDGAVILLAQVPMGAYLPGGAVYRLDNDAKAKQREMIWQRCLGAICEAALVLDADELKAMNKAGGILFGYRTDPNSDPVVTRVDMTDFTTGVDALRK